MNKCALINESLPKKKKRISSMKVYARESLYLTLNFIVNAFPFNVDSFV